MKKLFMSIAVWPEESDIRDEYGKPESRDYHHTEAEARAVCEGLAREGYGGDGEIFPVLVYVKKR